MNNKLLSNILSFTTIVLVIFVACPLGWAATYYVNATSGNDSNVGTSRDAPLKTIQKAADKSAPGDKYIVLPGSYNERVRITRSGASGQPIVYQAEGSSVITQGFTIDASYIHIVGFEITDTIDSATDGTGVTVNGSFCEVKSNYIHDTTRVGILLYYASSRDSSNVSNCIVSGNRIYRAGRAGIEINGRNQLVENNDISHTLQYPTKWVNYGSGMDADGILFHGSGHTIRKNRIHDILMSDPENKDPHIDCFQTWGPAYNIVFEQNFCDNPTDEMQGFMISKAEAPVQNLTVKNNIIKAFRLLNVWDCENIIIVNNSFKSELSYQGASGYGIELHNSPNSKVKNNLFYDVGRHSYPYLYKDSASEAGLDAGYNCHYMSDGTPPVGSPRSRDLWQVDPKLVNISTNDFHLQSGSPLINVGATLSEVLNDYDGNPRPQGKGYSIGAFEFFSSAPSSPKGLKVVQ